MDTEEELLPYAHRVFAQIWKQGSTCTQVGLALGNLTPAGGRQYSLFEPHGKLEQHENIQEALDTIHQRYGRDALMRGSATTPGRKRAARKATIFGDI
jgi:hypothetical protein